MSASDLMTPNPVQVSPNTSLRRAIQTMLDRNISGLPIVDDDGQVCGMLTEGDILRRSELALAPRAAPKRRDAQFFRNYVETHGMKVSDCMTRNVVSVAPEARLAEIVALMRTHNIKRLPVLEDGKLVGIVSRRDVLRAITTTRDEIARGDDALRLAVATRLQSELGLGPDRVEVRVRASVVEVVGALGSEAEREAIRVVAESIAGVSGVVTSAPATDA